MLSSPFLTLRKQFNERCLFLEKLILDRKKALERAPEGELKVSSSHGHLQYYQKNNKKTKYIRKKDLSLAGKLAQKDYDISVIAAAEEELRSIRLMLAHFPEEVVEDLYPRLPASRKELVVPFAEPDDVFSSRWRNKDYPSKGFSSDDTPLKTAKGLPVRSKSEVIIADMLDQYQIPYRYECSLFLRGLGTVYPDFTILKPSGRTEMVWEHLGLLEDPEYARKAVRKIQAYHQNGYFEGQRLILSYESLAAPFDSRQAEEIITRYLTD